MKATVGISEEYLLEDTTQYNPNLVETLGGNNIKMSGVILSGG